MTVRHLLAAGCLLAGLTGAAHAAPAVASFDAGNAASARFHVDTTTTIAFDQAQVVSDADYAGIALYTDDVDAEHAQLKEQGVDVDAEVSRMGDPVPPLFWLRDPENNTLMVVG